MYPYFKKASSGGLYAFLAKDRLFHLITDEYGKGDGFQFRIYKTKGTVDKHDTSANTSITFQEFKNQLMSVFANYLEEITLLLPKKLQPNNQFFLDK